MPPEVVRVIGPWGPPEDAAGWVALALAPVAALLAARPPAALRVSHRLFVGVFAFAAAALSLAYVAVYLRGGPRIVDATTYYLQGRALATSGFTFPVPEPAASFRGRFLLWDEARGMSGIFPPGWPIVLSLGFRLGAPMVVGPTLAALLVVATAALAREVALTLDLPEVDRERLARVAAVASTLCAAARYHTADTMSHGLVAVLAATALAFALRVRRGGADGPALAAGAAVGWVLATRLASFAPLAIVCILQLARAERRGRALALFAAGIVPGAAILLVAQRAATGSALSSTQGLYYALSDGPPGCFRYGFGKGVGCVFEHGDFVAARLAGGYGPLEALLTSASRLRRHTTDLLGVELLFPVAVVGLARGLRARSHAARALGGYFALQVLAYAPFYFDGNYPGGGARFLADTFGAGHVLAAAGALHLAKRWGTHRAAAGLAAAMLVAFAVRSSHEHVLLRDREGGRPMFEPDVAAKAGATRGLLFFATDHGFSLAHDPRARPEQGLVAARLREDANDWLLYERLGRPPTYRYSFDPARRGAVPEVAPYQPLPYGTGAEGRYRFEAESSWPPLAQAGGYAIPRFTHACAGNYRVLALSNVDYEARVTIDVLVPEPGRWKVRPRIVADDASGRSELTVVGTKARFVWGAAAGPTCRELPQQVVELPGPRARLELVARGGEALLDAIVLERERD
jgi:hypothetical protein